MSERDAFDERRRGLEESYFRKKEQELIEKMRLRAADEAMRRRMGEQTGVADDEILKDLQELGYTADNVTLLHLVPLVHLAWVDGSVAPRERSLILEAAKSRGIEPGTPAYGKLTAWLNTRPSSEVFDSALRAIAAILHSLPSAQAEATRRDLLSYSTAIASAAGGILGFGAVSDAERSALSRISHELEEAHGPMRDEMLPPK